MIKVDNVSKSFKGVEVLKDISIEFEPGKTNLIIGRSGAGKTVLLKTLIGLLVPTKGTVWYDDVDFYQLSEKQVREIRMEVGMLFQGGALFDSMTVEENIRFPLDMFTDWSYKERKTRVDEVLERVELGGLNDKLPSEISGGMKKRVGIGRAIVLNPRYLFCDEPNSGLDPKTSILIDELLSGLTREYNITTIINTHDMNSVMEIGEKIALLHKGELVWTGNHDEVMHSKNQYIRDFIFASPFLKDLRDRAIE